VFHTSDTGVLPRGTVPAAAALLAGLIATGFLLSGAKATQDVFSDHGRRTSETGVFDGEPGPVLVVAVVALTVTALPLLLHGKGRAKAFRVAAVVLLLGSLLALPSIGLFYLPSAVLMVAAALRQ
jgi:hypothetical protein